MRNSGTNPRANFGAKLSADHRLQTIKGKGWWFADEPVPVSALCEAGDLPQNFDEGISLSKGIGKIEEDPGSIAAGSLQSFGSEGVISRSTSVPSGRDNNGSAFVSSAPQHAEWEQ